MIHVFGMTPSHVNKEYPLILLFFLALALHFGESFDKIAASTCCSAGGPIIDMHMTHAIVSQIKNDLKSHVKEEKSLVILFLFFFENVPYGIGF
ncbi:hypothetical protein ACJX0J_019184, partial [Zea mays]